MCSVHCWLSVLCVMMWSVSWIDLTASLSLSFFSSLFTVSCQNNMLFFSLIMWIYAFIFASLKKSTFCYKTFFSGSKHSTHRVTHTVTLFSSHETRQLLTWLPQLWAHTKKYKAHYELLCDAIMLLFSEHCTWMNVCVWKKNE